MRTLSICIGAILALGALAGCGSTSDTADGGTAATALVAFNDSGCKKGDIAALTSGLAASRHTLLTVDGTQYAGLTCFSWDATGSTLKVDCLNFDGPCVNTWQGEAQVAEGNALMLGTVEQNRTATGECASAGCVGCIYDWSYEVKGVDTSKDSALTLTLSDTCATYSHSYSHTLPLASRKSGVLCRYADYYDILMTSSQTGTVDMPCRTPNNYQPDQPPVPCDTGLACTKMTINGNANAALCLKAGAADADCPLDGLLKCDKGVCVLKETW